MRIVLKTCDILSRLFTSIQVFPIHRRGFYPLPHWKPNNAHDQPVEIYNTTGAILETQPLKNVSPLAFLPQTRLQTSIFLSPPQSDSITDLNTSVQAIGNTNQVLNTIPSIFETYLKFSHPEGGMKTSLVFGYSGTLKQGGVLWSNDKTYLIWFVGLFMLEAPYIYICVCLYIDEQGNRDNMKNGEREGEYE